MPDFFSISACSSFFLDWRCSFSTIASALTMKMMSITRNTSVSGVMLISAKMFSVPSSTPTSSSGSFARAIAVLVAIDAFGALGALGGVVVVFALALAARLRVARKLEQGLEGLVRGELYLRRESVAALAG